MTAFDVATLEGAKSRAAHGTRTRYVAGCRCDECRASNTARWHARRAQAAELASEVRPSGPPIESTMMRDGREVRIVRCPGANGEPCVRTPATWLRGVEVCLACIERATVWDGLVPADRARAHLRKLRREGVGRLAVVAASDVARTTLAEIASGACAQIRASTERRILAVDAGARSDGAVVDGQRTRTLIARMLARGFTRTQIARELGYRTRALQVGRTGDVLLRTEARVEKLWRRVKRGELVPARAYVDAARERAWLIDAIAAGVSPTWLSAQLGWLVQRSDRGTRMRPERRDAVRRLRAEVEALTIAERVSLWPKYQPEALR